MARPEKSRFRLIGKVLRADYEDTKRQPLPKRWIDLLRHLDEQERKRPHRLPSEPSRQSGGQ